MRQVEIVFFFYLFHVQKATQRRVCYIRSDISCIFCKGYCLPFTITIRREKKHEGKHFPLCVFSYHYTIIDIKVWIGLLWQFFLFSEQYRSYPIRKVNPFCRSSQCCCIFIKSISKKKSVLFNLHSLWQPFYIFFLSNLIFPSVFWNYWHYSLTIPSRVSQENSPMWFEIPREIIVLCRTDKKELRVVRNEQEYRI